jgi:NAD(P)-dependent dehydrogenase (short-subunit alcohol dehydrogenase family)
MNLTDKVAFITGGTSGINLAIAKRFAKAGAKVTILGRNVEKAHAAAASFGAHAVTADVRDPEALQKAIDDARAKHGEIDILVCGAAGNFPAPALGMSPKGFKAVIDIDVLGTFNACRLAFDHLRKPGACILNISAPQAYSVAPLQSHVCAAKAGIDMLTKSLALEWGPLGVRVNSLTPGAVDGTEGMERLAPTPEAKQVLADRLPMRRMMSLDDISEVALFLCSPSASYITGSIVVADGGLSLVGFNYLMPM